MRMNKAGIELLKQYEGWRNTAYVDEVGRGKPLTIGYGHTSMAGPPKVTPGMKITKAEGEKILRNDLRGFEATVRNRVKVPINTNQFSALVSFCYNVGPGNFANSSALRAVNAERHDDVPRMLALWRKGTINGKKVTLRGLVRRRAAEGALYSTPVSAIENRDDLVASKIEAEPDTGKPLAKSKTALSAVGLGTVAGATTAGREIAENTSGIIGLVESPVFWVGLVAVSLAGFIIWDRYIKGKEFGA